MTDNNNQVISRQMVILCQQLLALSALDLALEAARSGKDYRPLLKELLDYAEAQAGKNPSKQVSWEEIILFVQAAQAERKGRES